jgi:hypothetical protein
LLFKIRPDFKKQIPIEVGKEKSMRMGGVPTRCAPKVAEEEQRDEIERTQ